MANEEYLLKLAALDQEGTRLEQQMQLLDQQIQEMTSIESSLKELDKCKEKQILANLGKNVFIKTEIKDKRLFVDVGNKTFIQKSITETVEIIEDQINKLSEAKNTVLMRIQELQHQMESMIVEIEKTGKKQNV